MQSLWGRRILVLEDEFLLAEEMCQILEGEGAVVIGPCATLEQVGVISLANIDAAVLNVRVGDGVSYPFARKLRELAIPFVFASGQDRLSEPKEWHGEMWISKPYQAKQLIAALHWVLGLQT